MTLQKNTEYVIKISYSKNIIAYIYMVSKKILN
jgi:hypothetical protein